VTVHWTQGFLAVAVIIQWGALVAAMVTVRLSMGMSAVGHAGGGHLAARVDRLATLILWLVALAYVIAPQVVNSFGRISPLDRPLVQYAGVVALALAEVCLIWGLISLGRSFRIALPESKQPLVTRGAYRFVRNPLALSVDLLALGMFLLVPGWLTLAVLALNVVTYEWKVRVEEAYLRQAHGSDYTTYCQNTGRYCPRLFARRQ
jgi:protein-S-isoprenylcysteine O-methyltransferase Ste14